MIKSAIHRMWMWMCVCVCVCERETEFMCVRAHLRVLFVRVCTYACMSVCLRVCLHGGMRPSPPLLFAPVVLFLPCQQKPPQSILRRWSVQAIHDCPVLTAPCLFPC